MIDDRTIALAGVLQACKQVQLLATTGECEYIYRDSSVKSILVLDAVNTAAVYGGVDGVRGGLTLLKDGVLNSPQLINVELLRYVMAILQLQNQLYRDDEKYQQFGQSVERLSGQSEEDLTDACSELYQTHISVMRPQIIVQGEQEYLQRADVPPQIRALLLAAFRSAVLWQQKEGSRFKLLWQRTRMQNAAQSLLLKGMH